jgi:hypothetical protein
LGMKRLILVLLIPLSFGLNAPAKAETALYCQEIASGGIVKDNGQWRGGNFVLDRHTFLVSDDRRTLKSKYHEYSCEGESNYSSYWLVCWQKGYWGVPRRIILSEDLSRFQLIVANVFSYVDEEESADTSVGQFVFGGGACIGV